MNEVFAKPAATPSNTAEMAVGTPSSWPPTTTNRPRPGRTFEGQRVRAGAMCPHHARIPRRRPPPIDAGEWSVRHMAGGELRDRDPETGAGHGTGHPRQDASTAGEVERGGRYDSAWSALRREMTTGIVPTRAKYDRPTKRGRHQSDHQLTPRRRERHPASHNSPPRAVFPGDSARRETRRAPGRVAWMRANAARSGRLGRMSASSSGLAEVEGAPRGDRHHRVGGSPWPSC